MSARTSTTFLIYVGTFDIMFPLTANFFLKIIYLSTTFYISTISGDLRNIFCLIIMFSKFFNYLFACRYVLCCAIDFLEFPNVFTTFIKYFTSSKIMYALPANSFSLILKIIDIINLVSLVCKNLTKIYAYIS